MRTLSTSSTVAHTTALPIVEAILLPGGLHASRGTAALRRHKNGFLRLGSGRFTSFANLQKGLCLPSLMPACIHSSAISVGCRVRHLQLLSLPPQGPWRLQPLPLLPLRLTSAAAAEVFADVLFEV